jgi:predicted membrane channel-forming protein YqfA (hemolysin III family)
MDELDRIFSDFKNQVNEIALHAKQVSTVNFKADLKNGTSFNFVYNADKFARAQGDKQEYRPLSVSNAIVDIVGAIGAVALLLVLLLRETRTDIPFILSYAMLITFFSLSATYHFFNRDSRTNQVFYYLKETAKILSLALINSTTIGFGQLPLQTLSRSLSLIAVAVSLLFLSGRTKLSRQASLAAASILPFISLMGFFSLDALVRCLLFSLWSAIALFAKPESRMSSNSIFALIGLIAFSFELSIMLLI